VDAARASGVAVEVSSAGLQAVGEEYLLRRSGSSSERSPSFSSDFHAPAEVGDARKSSAPPARRERGSTFVPEKERRLTSDREPRKLTEKRRRHLSVSAVSRQGHLLHDARRHLVPDPPRQFRRRRPVRTRTSTFRFRWSRGRSTSFRMRVEVGDTRSWRSPRPAPATETSSV
jgi:hypothetical protein